MLNKLLLIIAGSLFSAVVMASEGASVVTNEESLNVTTDVETQSAENADKLSITGAWARTSIPPNNNSAAYMVINNPSKEQINIVGASAAVVANNVELHKSFVDEKGISRMVAIDKIVVPAESSIELTPGGIHIMLFDLKKRLVENTKFEIILKILNDKPIKTEITVLNQ